MPVTDHARARFRERYGADLDNGLAADICKRLKEGRYLLVGRDGSRETCVVEIASGTRFRLVWHLGTIVTFLPLRSPKPRRTRTGKPKERYRTTPDLT